MRSLERPHGLRRHLLHDGADLVAGVLLHGVWSSGSYSHFCDILDQCVGTELERSGDIAIEINQRRYVIADQAGGHAVAAVNRPQGQEVVAAGRRPEVVEAVAQRGLVEALKQAPGLKFSLKELAASEWDSLSAGEQRQAGKRFRELLQPRLRRGEFADEKSSDNEWHYWRT